MRRETERKGCVTAEMALLINTNAISVCWACASQSSNSTEIVIHWPHRRFLQPVELADTRIGSKDYYMEHFGSSSFYDLT
ncbi:hypothetical protein CEXT_10241 [Caerostris extrusa]|uniref:Uncharacterized protein n=1 Tax=Caerostris extrusa TaxID=172846 RepID=A0AAV4NHM8_CAEEX|nr:hypothetical protein CEXT_10241 [Caerostris extrusa]